MIDAMTRLKVHHLVEGGLTQAAIAAKLELGLRSVERIAAEPPPVADKILAGKRAGKRGGPSKTAAFENRVRALLEERPELPPTEVFRVARTWGDDGGRSAMFDLVSRVRPPLKQKEPVVLLEGLPGEQGGDGTSVRASQRPRGRASTTIASYRSTPIHPEEARGPSLRAHPEASERRSRTERARLIRNVRCRRELV